MATRRPHHSNPPTFDARLASIRRSIQSSKLFYWTDARLEKLLGRIIKSDREQWFAARLRALKSWPERTADEIVDAASHINPTRLMDGRWAWPKGELAIQRDLLRSAPEDGINIKGLRSVLGDLDNRQADRFIEILLESGILEDFTVPLDNGLPQPQEVGLQALRRIRKADARLRRDLAGTSDGTIATARLPSVPRANLQSPPGWGGR
ncbi:hypothetical protein JQ608_28175 [Bradyrhizobium liaoningense]|uniref:hypothetical protein n=1 Tax=Bradyrhizobium liaoningense TaxID=43992 RepID=UPI001BAA7C69|nr:hypothetical protein [Bradyrhizobium liaoningense]MBR0880979.1 hypothetical protein [Bradyrhizobium liaoningense]